VLNRRLTISPASAKKQGPISETAREKKKKAEGMAQVAQHLSSKHKVLSSNPRTAKKKIIRVQVKARINNFRLLF
jgi:hypothetical protein